jgi:hypothetical protein
MVVPILSVLLAAAPALLVLLVGLGAAVWVWLRSPAAGVGLGVGIVVLGLAEGIGAVGDILLNTPLLWSLDGATLQLISSGLWISVTLVRGLGVLGLLAAACVGPAPMRAAE